MNQNSNRYNAKLKNSKICTTYKFQSYDPLTFGKVITYHRPISCAIQKNCDINQCNFNKFVWNQQNTYALMRRFPEKFPIIPWTSENGLTPGEQRQYSTMFWKRLGTSQNLPVNNNWGGFAITGSEVPYTN
jgi:hypothetical protein